LLPVEKFQNAVEIILNDENFAVQMFLPSGEKFSRTGFLGDNISALQNKKKIGIIYEIHDRILAKQIFQKIENGIEKIPNFVFDDYKFEISEKK